MSNFCLEEDGMERYNECDVMRSRAGTAPGVLGSSILFDLVNIGNYVKEISLSKREDETLFSNQREEGWS